MNKSNRLFFLVSFVPLLALLLWNQTITAEPEIITDTSPQQFVQSNSENSESNPALLLLNKIEAMQKEIQALRGQLEVQAHDLKILHSQQQAFYQDLDDQIQAVKKSQRVNLASAKQSEKTQPRNTQSTSKGKGQTSENDVNGESRYSAAFELVKLREYDQAITGMQAFLRDFPKSNYAPNAHYWLGELYLLQGQVNEAVNEFKTVITRYPDSNKVAGARLKLGFAYFNQGKWQQARQELSTVKQKFPNSVLARLAHSRLQDMDKQGL